MKKSSKPFSISKRIGSFSFAINGLRILIANEHNARIHLVAAVLAIILSYWLSISAIEWIAVVLCIGWVFMAELFNSAVEYLADFVCGEHNEVIGKVKDLAAGGVLVSAIASAIVGVIIFAPKLAFLI
ncbi:MAG: diacylglycerol kinase [Crocinitomicaceae bacterium]|nr:diacylglycerol kinase [Crocinitomicaceae bacterium]|tara:strand:+ start:3411 stop:3794 length:384 start_codon:yes stop_codon:yes gene_type:complete